MNFVVLDTRYSGIYPKLPELGDLARTKRVTGLDTFFLIFTQSAFRDGPDLVGVRQSIVSGFADDGGFLHDRRFYQSGD